MTENLKPANEAIPVDDDAELKEMHDFPFERVQMLLGIIEKQSAVVPRATHLSSIAQTAIDDMNNKAKDIARRRNTKIVAADAKRAEAERNRLKKLNDDAHEAANAGRPGLQARAIPSEQLAGNPQPQVDAMQPGQPMPDRAVPVADEDIGHGPEGDPNEHIVGEHGAPTLAERRI